MTSPSGIPESNHPSAQQIATAIELLGDDAGAVHASARERLLHWGEVAVQQLESAAEADRLLVRLRSRAVLRTLEVQKDLREFGALRLEPIQSGSPHFASTDSGSLHFGQPASQEAVPPLLEGAALLSRMVRTFVPPGSVLSRRLLRHATVLRRQFAGRSLPTCARLLAERLHDDVGLKGHGENGGGASALELDHVLIDRVLDTGTGVPVSLSIIYLLVARWAGLSVAGVALPDHFLVRLHGIRPVLVDPFHAGRTITKCDCARYLRSSGFDQVSHYLRDLDDREVLAHYLRSLQRATSHRGAADARQALARARVLLETV
ncbi:MAG: transglutaminase family protein [Planctomycetes bacterium]|nr:transglutaminase family protein [Planctomycetota bacterium]